MSRRLVAALIIGSVGISAHSQQAGTSALPAKATSLQREQEYPDKPEALRRIALYEASIRQLESSTPIAGEALLKAYQQLGSLYVYVAMYAKAEDAMRHAIALLRNGPQDQLAAEIGQLAILHIAMGELHESEKEDFEALRIREQVGDPLGIAQVWNDLGGLYVKKRDFRKAADFAQKAMAVLGDDPRGDPIDRIAVRQTLGVALCELHDCARAIPILKESIELAKATFGPESLPVGVAGYFLGTAYWRNGDMVTAADWLSQGIASMKATLGWGHPTYLNALTKYAHFLRQRGDVQAADLVESEVRQASAVVDVRTLTAGSSAFAAGVPQ